MLESLTQVIDRLGLDIHELKARVSSKAINPRLEKLKLVTKEQMMEDLYKFSFRYEDLIDDTISKLVSIPKGIKLYPEQEDIVYECMMAIADGHKTICLELPTGYGKSLIAISISLLMYKYKIISMNPYIKTMILTNKKLLQNQYKNSFKFTQLVKGKSNYICLLDFNKSVSEAKCKRELAGYASSEEEDCPRKYECQYYKMMRNLKQVNYIVSNYHWFIYNTEKFTGMMRLGVVFYDEAHLLEDILLDTFSATEEDLIQLVNDLRNKVRFEYGPIHITDEEFMMVKNLAKTSNNLKDVVMLLWNLLPDFEEAWKMYSEFLGESLYDRLKAVAMKGLSPFNIIRVGDKFLPESLTELIKYYREQFSEYNIYMSATISKQYFSNDILGDTPHYYIARDSLFKKENRRIYNIPLFQMNYTNMQDKKYLEEVKDFVTKMVNSIQHENEKGLVFVSSFSQAELFKGVNRFIIHTNNNYLNQLIDKLKESENGVLVSPSIAEGLDLPGDLSRFQIVLKIPFTNFNDPEVKLYGENWYYNKVCTKLVQMTGRSVRNKDDYAVTYIIDANIKKLLFKNYFPQWWIDSIEEVSSSG